MIVLGGQIELLLPLYRSILGISQLQVLLLSVNLDMKLAFQGFHSAHLVVQVSSQTAKELHSVPHALQGDSLPYQGLHNAFHALLGIIHLQMRFHNALYAIPGSLHLRIYRKYVKSAQLQSTQVC